MRAVHVITPGDHYSPRTGSAIPTVVHGLASGSRTERPTVVVARNTYPDRYPSAEVALYDPPDPLRLPRLVPTGMLDAALGAAGLPRVVARHQWSAAVAGQAAWGPAAVFAHNGPQLVPLVDARRHAPFLYAHNDVLRTYRRREAAHVLAGVRGVVCVSHFLADKVANRLPPVLQDRVRVVHNGVDTTQFRRTAPLRADGLLNVVFVGRMVPGKGALVLVEAVRRLGRPDVRLTLVGSKGFDATVPPSRYETRVRESAAALGDRVRMLPFLPRPEVAQVVGTADVVVVPSTWAEPFALTVREGMAAGAAVVASDVGGIPEALGGTGVLVRPGDAGQLADALGALADDHALLASTARACESYVRQHDWSAAADALAGVVEELAT